MHISQKWCANVFDATSALQRADAELQAGIQKVERAQQLVPDLPSIDKGLVACMRKGLFVNVISGALSQCAVLSVAIAVVVVDSK